MRHLIVIIATCVLALSATTASADRVPGYTPADGVCGELQGATPGLYGLCNAFCEAHDAGVELSDTDDPFDFLSVPNSRILRNYEKKMQSHDPYMPCIMTVSSCPLWTPEELNLIGTHGWRIKRDTEVIESNGDELFEDREQNSRIVYHFARVEKRNWKGSFLIQGVYAYVDRIAGIPDTIVTMELTEEEYDACKTQLINHATEL